MVKLRPEVAHALSGALVGPLQLGENWPLYGLYCLQLWFDTECAETTGFSFRLRNEKH